MGGLSLARRRYGVLAAAVLLYAAVFAARLLEGSPGAGIGFLYLLPIVLVAVELGRSAGVLGALVALGLFCVWNWLAGVDMSMASYLSRATMFLLVGAVTGQLADQLRRTGERLEQDARHFELARDLLCRANFDGYLTHLNGSWEETLGWSREELMSKPFIEFVHPDDRARTQAEAGGVSNGDSTASFTNRYQTKNGGWRWIEWSSRTDVVAQVIYAAARDVTERREAEHLRREAEERFRRAFEDSAIGIALVGVGEADSNVILEANEGLARIIGRPREELVGTTTLSDLADSEDVPALAHGMRRLQEGQISVYRHEFRATRADGRPMWVDLTSSLVRDEEGTPLYRLSQVVDIDARKRAEQELRYLADHDPLSGTLNRRRFEQELQRELAHTAQRGSRGAVLMLDVDDFKEINDSHGHAAGDTLITRLGELLTSRMRTGDVIARIGGDEFAVLLRRVDADHAVEVAWSVQALASEELAVDSRPAGRVTLSIGVAPFGHDVPPSKDGILKAADAAMYSAKRTGGNHVSLAENATHPTVTRLAGAS